ncbi:DUF1501 domain-containing protein [Planctellipticum variicoloris]|uniref:DUF1501 domain-containing protein n=1 Tax=Planctellipticum variicoloris TaxID=3064265 RepID=UPI00301374CA|nr:DUF1501 domain-containing protein [Planctomycetaceae bacterium SH412]
MLSLFGRTGPRFCDRQSRRSFLKIGGLAAGGLSLPQLLRAEDRAGLRGSRKSIIMIYLTGGPPHLDMVDLKPDAPAEIRGEFQPIATSIPGIQISELMPRVAGMMDKFAIIRSLVGAEERHSSFQCSTGRMFRTQPQGGWPEIGSILSKLQGAAASPVPPAIDLSMHMEHLPYNLPGAGFLGMAHTPFKPSGDAMSDMVLNGANADRLDDRGSLLASLDRYQRQVDQLAPLARDNFTERALGILSAPRLVEALDLSREDPSVRERYGKDDPNCLPYSAKGYQAHMSKFLAARRLVEAGARCVTVSFADFDWHGSNFAHGRKVIPLLDQGLAALVSDLHERGLDRDVTVVVWGEFSRTPKINPNAGRDHWPAVTFAMLAGGSMRTGQVIGETNRLGEVAVSRPVHFEEVFATLYHNLGIDITRTTIPDLNGRPQYLVENQAPIAELI